MKPVMKQLWKNPKLDHSSCFNFDQAEFGDFDIKKERTKRRHFRKHILKIKQYTWQINT